jgi:50S ribosomal subunit-associated GTPase HflX
VGAGAGPVVPDAAVAGSGVVLVGFFSARRKDFPAVMEAAAATVTARGGRVVGEVVQRRGVSRGGVRLMGVPYSSRTVLSSGKVREAVELRERTGADLVVFVTPLTGRQRLVLAEVFRRPVTDLADLLRIPAPDGAEDQAPVRAARTDAESRIRSA